MAMIEDLEEFEEVPFFDELAEKWGEENKDNIFLHIIPAHGWKV